MSRLIYLLLLRLACFLLPIGSFPVQNNYSFGGLPLHRAATQSTVKSLRPNPSQKFYLNENVECGHQKYLLCSPHSFSLAVVCNFVITMKSLNSKLSASSLVRSFGSRPATSQPYRVRALRNLCAKSLTLFVVTQNGAKSGPARSSCKKRLFINGQKWWTSQNVYLHDRIANY